MESEDDIELLPSSPVHDRKLKRLKKAVRVPENSRRNTLDNGPSTPHVNSFESDSLLSISDNPNVIDFDELNVGSGPAFDSTGDENGLRTELDASESVKEDGLGAMRVLEFDSVAEDLDGNVDACSMEAEKVEEVGDLKTEEQEKKRRRLDSFAEKREKKKKRVDGEKVKESTSNKRKAEKERRDNLRQLRAESQRLLRETRDAAFKSIPLVQKPISSILDKIRQRKLEVLKKSSSFIDDNDDGYVREVLVDDVSEHACLGDEIVDKVENGERQETFTCPADMKINLDASQIGGSGNAANCSTIESIPCPVAEGSESDNVFRAPIDDTQEIYSNSQRSDSRDEALNEELNSPLEVFEPSIPTMNLKLDSAPPDDVSSDEEDNDKENTDPHPHGSADLLPLSGDPVKAFVDEEAEVEDNSDNDLMHFQEDEDDDEDDPEELNKMIATEYEENPIDRERRDQFHQLWLEQQDAAGMDNLLQKLNCGSKLRDTSIGEEEDEESNETENESDDEVEEYAALPNAARINLEKVKQMIPQMFTDKDDAYVSSDDEETEKRLAKQCLFDRTEEQATFLSPAEDEGCREVFSLIKKLNIVPDTKRKGSRTSSFLDTPLIGKNINISSKSSFLNRASNQSMPSSQRHGPNKARSFIFGRDDSNSRTSITTMSEDSSDTIQRESQLPKTVRPKFKSNTQNKYNDLNSASEKSGTSLLEILRKSSLHAKRCVRNDVDVVQQTESAFAAFKLAKKPIKSEGRV